MTFVANAYTLAFGTQMSSLQISMANFWTSTGTGYLDGTRFPALIRVSGQLEDLTVRNISRLAVFFSNLVPFDSELGSDGKQYASCTSTLNKLQKCIRYLGDSTAT